MKILFIDTETGGLDPNKHSLLSVGLALWEDSEIMHTEEFFVKEEEYNVTEIALKINKIDLEKLKKIGISKIEIKENILKFIKKNFDEEKIILAGQNVNFDISFLKKLFSLEEFSQIFSYRSVDIASILKYISLKKNIDISSLDEAMKYYGIKTEKRHTALEDAKIAAEIFTKLLEE